ncbi:MAG TPA: S41 family peptidase [Anaerolineales bacterium]|nr:S41 family peptidase [Anaerolineales bacterium]
MKTNKSILAVLFIFSFALSACAGFAPEDEPITGDFGAQYTPQEHQTRVFDAIQKHLVDNYIYYESAGLDWDALFDEYHARISDGLTNDEFNALMLEFTGKLPEGALLFQSRDERIAAETESTSTYEGIGAFIGFDAEAVPHIIVLGVIEGSPAEQAGIRAHDSIYAIDGNPILLEEGIDVVKRVRGPAGSVVALNVQTPGKPERTVEVTRAQLVSASQIEARQIDVQGAPYGYILFPVINNDSLFKDLLANLQKLTTNQKLEGLVLDLRVAGSSRGWPLEELLKLFHDGKVGTFYNSQEIEQSVSVTGADLFGSQSVPLIILVGQHTSGSPEILAAALQVNKRAIVIGETTPGAIEATTLFYLPDGSRIFIETSSFKLPNGEDLGRNGVQPQITIDAGWDDILPAHDPVLEKALELLSAGPEQ